MIPEISILGQKYSSYNLSIIVGIIFVIGIFSKYEKSVEEREKDNVISLMGITLLVSFLSAILGDKLMHFTTWSEFKNQFFKLSGMTFIWGFIGGVAFFFIGYTIMCKSIQNTLKIMNVLTPYFIIGQMFGRLGCLLGGCCYGKPSDHFIGLTYPENSPAFLEYGKQNLYPTPLMEIGWLLVILLCCQKVKNLENKKVMTYFVMYPIGRFVLEFFRGDDRGTGYLGMSPSQTVCVAMLVGSMGIGYVITRWNKRRIGGI